MTFERGLELFAPTKTKTHATPFKETIKGKKVFGQKPRIHMGEW